MRIALALACLLLASIADAKDLTIRQRSTAGLGGGLVEETVYLTDDTIVTDSPVMRTIVDLSKRTITSADKSKRTYTTLTFDELTAQMDAIRGALETLPPEARKQMSALLNESGPVTITPTGKTDTIAGYPAKEHSLRGGPYSGSIWTTDAIATPPAFQKWKSMEKSRGGAARQLGEAIEKLSGFPLRTHVEAKTGGAPMIISNEVIEVAEKSPPSEVRSVPKGYEKQEPPSMPPPGARPQR